MKGGEKAEQNKQKFFELLDEGMNFEDAICKVWLYSSTKDLKARRALEAEYEEWKETRQGAGQDPTAKCEEFVRLASQGVKPSDIWRQLYPELASMPSQTLATMANAYGRTPEVVRERKRQQASAAPEKHVDQARLLAEIWRDTQATVVAVEKLVNTLTLTVRRQKEIEEQLRELTAVMKGLHGDLFPPVDEPGTQETADELVLPNGNQ